MSVIALARWAQTWLLGSERVTVISRHRGCGAEVHAEITCARGHRDIGPYDLTGEPGPAAQLIKLRDSQDKTS